MREVHIRQPIWDGDRSQVFVGIAQYRVRDEYGFALPGKIRIWIDYREVNNKLAYPNPFTIKCSDVLKYRAMELLDHNHTVVHVVPLGAMKEIKERRVRIITQPEFQRIKAFTLQIQEQDRIDQALKDGRK